MSSTEVGEHPDRNKVPGVETNTGPLGHGFPVAVGIAIGRNIWAYKDPGRMVAALGAIIHGGASVDEAVRVAQSCGKSARVIGAVVADPGKRCAIVREGRPGALVASRAKDAFRAEPGLPSEHRP